MLQNDGSGSDKFDLVLDGRHPLFRQGTLAQFENRHICAKVYPGQVWIRRLSLEEGHNCIEYSSTIALIFSLWDARNAMTIEWFIG